MDPFEIYAIVAAGLFFLVLIVVSFMIRRRSQIRKTERAFVHPILPTTPMSGPEVVVVPREVTPVSRSVYPANDRLPLVSHSSSPPPWVVQHADET